MHFDEESLLWLQDEMEPEGEVRLIVRRADLPHDICDGIPASWLSLLDAENQAKNICEMWNAVAEHLPTTISIIRDKLCGIGLLLSEQRPPSLLYLFQEEGEPYVYRGGMPPSSMPEIAAQFPCDLQAFYSIHDGWIDLGALDGGLLPAGSWQYYQGSSPDEPFVAVCANGSTRLGFGRVDQEWRPYFLWPNDDEVKSLGDFWSALDELYAALLEDLQDAP